MYNALLSFIFLIGLSVNAVANCGNCVPLYCENKTYSLEKVFECLEACKNEGTRHGAEVRQKCQERVDKELGGGHEEQKAAAVEDAPMSRCQIECDGGSCPHYSLNKALDCQLHCEADQWHHDPQTVHHAKDVIQQCQKTIDDQMRKAQQEPSVFPDACGNAEKFAAIRADLVPTEGFLVYKMGGWKLEVLEPDLKKGGAAGNTYHSVSLNVGEIGTGRGNGDAHLLGYTPAGWVVVGHVDPKTNVVMCLSQAHKPAHR